MLAALVLMATVAIPFADPLAEGFANPPASVRPHTWWHWMNGNVTREGVTADLEAMKEVGIGGAQLFTVDQNIPAGPAGYAGAKWRELTAHAVREAGRLGIELCFHNCAGWSSSGGPWIKPEDAMQVIAWSETTVEGPRNYNGVLPQPQAPQVVRKVDYHRDIAVFAYPTPEKPFDKPADFLARTGVNRGDGLQPLLGIGPGIPVTAMQNLSGRLSADGRLTWNVPPGKWTILRLGHVPTGKNNHPAPPEGDGLEVDKLSKQALNKHWDGIVAKVLADAGPLAGKVLNNSLVDSYEVGSQNWTPGFRAEFQRRRGYDCFSFLPVIAGVTVESKETSERFLWDFRRTIADLYADNYFGHFGDLCHRAGMKFSVEPYGNGGFDNIQVGSRADIPMGEFWIPGWSMESVKLAASVGHVYGKPIVGAEAFTADEGSGKWLEEPFNLKAVGDRAFANGLNRVIFHRYAMQPWLDVKPGMTMGPWGTHFDRTQTWWTEAKEWLRYLSRCQYMLQRGRFVADVAYYYGEGAPVDLPSQASLKPAIPAGYDYDGVDANAVRLMTVRDGRVVLPSGMSYRVLVLPEASFMTVRMATKIKDLVAAGATVLGPKPEHTPSLSDYPASEHALQKIADEVWGGGAKGMRTFGKGRVAVDLPLEQVLATLNVAPDFQQSPRGNNLMAIHRQINGADVYFVSNQTYRPKSAVATFRVMGRKPELWHADTGVIEDAHAYRSNGGSTSLTLDLGPAESVFVVFRKPMPKRHVESLRADVSVPGQVAPKIEILSGFYGSRDGIGADVSDKVRELVAAGETSIPATNGLFGDPVVNVVKRLIIVYRLNGVEKRVEAPENSEAVLLPAAPVLAPAYSVSSVANGSVEIVPWRSGIFAARFAGGGQKSVAVRSNAQQLDLSRNWQVKFAPNLGAPAGATFTKLISWPDHSNSGIRYFSGSAIYTKEFNLPTSMSKSGNAVRLDLGSVKNFATLTVNGKSLPPLWKPPFVVDVTRLLRPGRNRLSVKVTNLWPNRIIGDEQLPPEAEWNGNHMDRWPKWLKPGKARITADRPKTGRITFSTWRYFDKSSPLLPSGLIGPVRLESAVKLILRP